MEADDEAQLQTQLKGNPDLLPVEDFGLEGPIMIVGEETSLRSGKPDLVGCTRNGSMVIIELKTGPKNSDFRRSLAQLLDYGADVWKMSLQRFESRVSIPYFASDRCKDPKLWGAISLDQAARITWDQISDGEVQAFADNLASTMAAGSFEYVLAAQRFTPATLRTIEYLNSESKGCRFYAVELVRFQGEGLSAFESRTVLKPQTQPFPAKPVSKDESSFLEGIKDDHYRAALKGIFDDCRELDLEISWGPAGARIRVATQFSPNRFTIAWVYAPGKSVYMRLTDFSMGFEWWATDAVPDARPVLERYAEGVSELPGAQRVEAKISASSFAPGDVVIGQQVIVEKLSQIVAEAWESEM